MAFPDREEKAESIIKTEGLIFALAVKAGKEGDIREARGYLKAAIVRALDAAAHSASQGKDSK